MSGGAGGCTASGNGTVNVPLDGAPQMVIYDRILGGPALRSYAGRGQLDPPLTYTYTLTCPEGTMSLEDQIDVWFEPPWGSALEPTFKAIKNNGIRIEDVDFREEGFGTVKIYETRTLNAKAQP